jgi:hypothetical protein
MTAEEAWNGVSSSPASGPSPTLNTPKATNGKEKNHEIHEREEREFVPDLHQQAT